MSPAPLTVHNAEITTAAVEVKTLTIKGKQVTLAVFRQLREELLISEAGTLNGVPWGIVNYHPDKCADAPEHWHVVWQRGSDLLRAAVVCDPQQTTWGCQEGNDFLTLCHRDSLNGGTTHFGGEPPKEVKRGYADYATWSVRLTREAPFIVELCYDGEVDRALDAVAAVKKRQEQIEGLGASHASHPYYQESLAKEVDAAKAALAALDELCQEIGATTDEMFRAYRSRLAAEVARRERHRQIRQAIANLPQLFIAV